MKPRDRRKVKGRKESGTFILIPHAVLDSANWGKCSGNAIKLLCELARQYNGRNNGDLCATLSLMKRHGWTRSATLQSATKELRHYGLLQLSRQGGLNSPSLFALTWKPVDECGGKLQVPGSRVASNVWNQPTETFQRPRRKQSASTAGVSRRYAQRPNGEGGGH